MNARLYFFEIAGPNAAASQRTSFAFTVIASIHFHAMFIMAPFYFAKWQYCFIAVLNNLAKISSPYN
jgi:hypothetical protein